MRRVMIGIGALVVLAAAAYSVRAVGRCHFGEGATGKAAHAASAGKLAGRFDPVLAGVCRFACAEKAKYDPAELVAQPASDLAVGTLTQCPVSGVVFRVDARRPRALGGDDEYVFCCDRCARKFVQTPDRYLSRARS